MKSTKQRRLAGAFAAVVMAGTTSGGVGAANASPPTYEAELPPVTILGNGEAAGGWRLDTPVSERPAYIEAELDDGTRGYQKVADIEDGFVMPPHAAGEVVDVTKELAEAERRQRDVMVQPNAKGEIWAPLYAKDGTTVLGKKLMNPHDDLDQGQ